MDLSLFLVYCVDTFLKYFFSEICFYIYIEISDIYLHHAIQDLSNFGVCAV